MLPEISGPVPSGDNPVERSAAVFEQKREPDWTATGLLQLLFCLPADLMELLVWQDLFRGPAAWSD